MEEEVGNSMPLFGKKSDRDVGSPAKVDYKARLEHKLYLARENPEPIFDLADCALKTVPSGIYSLCKVFRKEALLLQNNHLSSLSGGGSLGDLGHIQVLDLQNNDFHQLPQEVGDLIQLKVLHVQHNKLKHLPSSLGNLKHLEILTASNNLLKDLPESVGNLKRLKTLDVSENHKLKALPQTLSETKCLENIVVDSEHLKYPPQEVTVEGTEAIMRFLCKECDIEYAPPVPHPVNSPDDTCSSLTCSLLASDDYDALLQEQKRADLLVMEQQLEEQQRKELEIQASSQLQKMKLLDDLAAHQTRLEEEIQNIQQEKEADRQRLVRHLYEVEAHSDELILQLLTVNERYKDPTLVLDTLESERKELEKLFQIRQEECDNLQRKDVLKAMQVLFEDQYHREQQRQQYEAGRDEILRLALGDEVAWDKHLEAILAARGQEQETFISQLLEDEKYQREAFEALFMQKDQRNQNIMEQMELIQNELAALTMVEMKKKDMKLDFQVNVLHEKRGMLTLLLLQLIEQQKLRKEELMKRINELEVRRSEDLKDYWLIQYQRLMESKPPSLAEREQNLDSAVKELLYSVKAEEYIPYFAKRNVTIAAFCAMTDEDLREVGVKDKTMRCIILNGVKEYLKLKAALSGKLASLEQDVMPEAGPSPSAPPMDEGIAEFQEPAAAAVPSAPPAPENLEFREPRVHITSECVVCLDSICHLIFLPCGHVCCCWKCGNELQLCPLCRATIAQKIQLFTC